MHPRPGEAHWELVLSRVIIFGVCMLPYLKIAEQRIREALERGEFDDLPGRGEPLTFEDDSRVPEDLRLAYKLLKNADCLPPELALKKEIRQMEDMLESIPDEKEKYRQIKQINYKIMKLNMMGHKSPLLEEKEIYYKKLVEKFDKK
jgi:TusA-related sulfurtransferase